MPSDSSPPSPPPATPLAPHPLVSSAQRLTRHLSEDFLGGPRLLRMADVINFQKGLTGPFVLGLMTLYGSFGTTAWVYLALHGSYGLLWLVKHEAFPDARWEKRITIGGALLSFLLVLGPYWVLPWLLVSRGTEAEAPLLAAAIALHTVGVGVMLSADAQKHFARRARPGLVVDGMHARTRHPNYLGEMMVYGAYAVLVRHWLAWAILAWVWTAIFLVNILAQEASLARHPGFAEWRHRTGLLLPKL